VPLSVNADREKLCVRKKGRGANLSGLRRGPKVIASEHPSGVGIVPSYSWPRKPIIKRGAKWAAGSRSPPVSFDHQQALPLPKAEAGGEWGHLAVSQQARNLPGPRSTAV
jgi:hypothetical protein